MNFEATDNIDVHDPRTICRKPKPGKKTMICVTYVHGHSVIYVDCPGRTLFTLPMQCLGFPVYPKYLSILNSMTMVFGD